MNLPTKKRATRVLAAMIVTIFLLGCGWLSTANDEETVVYGGTMATAYSSPEPAPAPVSEPQLTASLPALPMPVTIEEADAAPASEEVEEVPTLDRTKPIYEVYKGGYAVNVPTDLQWHLRDMCEKYNYPERAIYGMILTESTFDPNAYNAGCYGLAQINKFWIRGANIEHFTDDWYDRDLCDPYDNILTLFEMWEYCRATYELDPWVESDMVKFLYWHNTGKDPRRVTQWDYADKALYHADELVQLQG